MTDENSNEQANLIELATSLTVAWLDNPNVTADAESVPSFLKLMHDALRGLGEPVNASQGLVTTEYTPAVPVRSSVKPDYIVSLIDGKKFKTLKRHLGTHGLTPAQYRERYGLKPDYPMVAPNYAAKRSETAKRLGLGRKRPSVASLPSSLKPAPASRKTLGLKV